MKEKKKEGNIEKMRKEKYHSTNIQSIAYPVKRTVEPFFIQ